MLKIEQLSKSYGETLALQDVSIAFEAGAVHAILGENGSGKSTLVKLLSGIAMPTRGNILVAGSGVSTSSPSAMRDIGIATVFQEVLIAPDRTVTDNILLGCDGIFRRSIAKGDRTELASSVLRKLTAAQIHMNSAAGDLPLAIRQLIVIARAFVQRPRFLILDEITAALDYGDREAVFQEIERFVSDGGTVIFISHRMDEVMRLAKNISVLRSGRLIQTLSCSDTNPVELLRAMAPEAVKEIADGI